MVAEYQSTKKINYLDPDHLVEVTKEFKKMYGNIDRKIEKISISHGVGGPSYVIKLEGELNHLRSVPYSHVAHLDIKIPSEVILTEDSDRKPVKVKDMDDFQSLLNKLYDVYGMGWIENIEFLNMTYGEIIYLHQFLDSRKSWKGYRLK